MDAVATVAGFVLVLPAVLAAVFIAPFAVMTTNALGRDSARYGYMLVPVVTIAPPVAVLGCYLTGVVFAIVGSAPRWYYPWVTFAVGAALWAGIAGAGLAGINRAARPVPGRRRDPVARYALAGTVRVLDSAGLAEELDGRVLDDRTGTAAPLWLIGVDTARRARGLRREQFDVAHRRYRVCAAALPVGWQVERSTIPPGGGGSGGGVQYRFLPAPGAAEDLTELVGSGFLQPVPGRGTG